MQNSQYLDFTTFNPVGGEVGSTENNQFPGAFDPTWAAKFVVLKQAGYLLFNFVTLLNGGQRIVGSNKVNYRIKITLRGRQPFDDQDRVSFTARAFKAFFLSAQWERTFS